jgi:hypothetical protein
MDGAARAWDTRPKVAMYTLIGLLAAGVRYRRPRHRAARCFGNLRSASASPPGLGSGAPKFVAHPRDDQDPGGRTHQVQPDPPAPNRSTTELKINPAKHPTDA